MTGTGDKMDRANPVDREALDPVVAMDRRELFDLLEADSRRRRGGLRLLSGGAGRPTRAGYVGAMVTAAAAVVAVFTFGGADGPTETDAVQSAADTDTVDPPATGDHDGSEAVTDPPVVVTTDEGPESDVGDAATATVAATDGPTTSDETAGPTGSTGAAITGDFDRSVDLMAVHFDHSNSDDGHSATAARQIGLRLDVDMLLVNGTFDGSRDDYVIPYESLIRATWDPADTLNADDDYGGAVADAVARWLVAIDRGGRVWVAEGGVSDFTADVIEGLRRERPGIDTVAKVNVVQHAARNEEETIAGALDFVKTATSYQYIDDGNNDNGSADLSETSERFEAAALQGPDAAAWQAAFEHRSASELDFSDTVEVLHILGIGRDQVADVDDFARLFLE